MALFASGSGCMCTLSLPPAYASPHTHTYDPGAFDAADRNGRQDGLLTAAGVKQAWAAVFAGSTDNVPFGEALSFRKGEYFLPRKWQSIHWYGVEDSQGRVGRVPAEYVEFVKACGQGTGSRPIMCVVNSTVKAPFVYLVASLLYLATKVRAHYGTFPCQIVLVKNNH